jgi:hypothetical protein
MVKICYLFLIGIPKVMQKYRMALISRAKDLVLILLFSMATVVAVAGQDGLQSCPTLTIKGPAGITSAGDTMVFTATATGSRTFSWTVSAGTIESGQSTSTITVRTTRDMSGSNVTATVSIGAVAERNSGTECPSTVSDTAGVMAEIACGLAADDYGRIRWADERARLDNLLIQIRHNPDSRALLLISIEENETLDSTKKHISNILKHLRSRDRDFDLSRMNFAVKRSEQHSTKVYIVPEGADFPECRDCTFVNTTSLSP